MMKEYQVQAVVQTAGVIAVNYEQMDSYLEGMELAYQEFDVTEDNIPEARENRATLNKIYNEIEARRKAIKREFEKPEKAFEEELKKRTARIQKIIGKIDGDLALFENKRKAEKRKQIEKIYQETIGEYEKFLPLERIRNSRWDNKTCSEKEIISEIKERIMQVNADLSIIRQLRSEIEDKCIEAYLMAGNQLSAAIGKNASYLEAKEMAEKRAMAAEHKTIQHAQMIPDASKQWKEEWKFIVFTKEDADFIKLTCASTGIMFREE